MKIPKIEYEVYYKANETNLVKLNLNYCKNCRANLLTLKTLKKRGFYFCI